MEILIGPVMSDNCRIIQSLGAQIGARLLPNNLSSCRHNVDTSMLNDLRWWSYDIYSSQALITVILCRKMIVSLLE